MSSPKMERTRNPGIFKRGGRYVVVWRHKGKQHKSFHRTLAEAREAQGQRRQRSERAPVSREPFEDYARAWLDSYQGRTARGFTGTSREAYGRTLEQYAIPFFEGYRLSEMEPPDVRRYVAHLGARGLSAGSVAKNLTPLKALLATARDDGAIRSNPADGVRVNGRRDDAEEEPEKAKAMTRADLARVLAEVPDDWRLFFELLAHSGLRISEQLGLDWSDVEFGTRPRLRVRRQYYRGVTKQLKTRHGRRDLPLSTGMARRLWAARPAHGSGAVFATRNGTRYSDRNVRRILDGAAERAGVPWVHFHTFRHTCASILFESGKSIRQVAGWLGHSDPAFTLRTYVHLMDDGLGDADFLDGAVGNAWVTRRPETAGNAEGRRDAESAV